MGKKSRRKGGGGGSGGGGGGMGGVGSGGADADGRMPSTERCQFYAILDTLAEIAVPQLEARRREVQAER